MTVILYVAGLALIYAIADYLLIRYQHKEEIKAIEDIFKKRP